MYVEHLETLACVVGGQTLELAGAGVVAVAAAVALALERPFDHCDIPLSLFSLKYRSSCEKIVNPSSFSIGAWRKHIGGEMIVYEFPARFGIDE